MNRRLQNQLAQLSLPPAVLNSGLAGVLALAAAAGWYAIVHAPSSLSRLISQ
jgi:hypothetical protein